MGVFLVVTCLIACSLAANAQNQLVNSINEFGIDLLKQVSPNEENVFFSSASISTAFAMLLAGSRTQSAEQLAETIKMSGLDNVHDLFHGLMSTLKPRAATDQTYELGLANKLVVASNFKVLNDYYNVIRNKYSASLDIADMVQDGAKVAKDINSWVSEQTRGMVKEIFDKPLDARTRLVLINAIYFKGSWTTKFDAKDTKKRTFHGLEHNEVDFMYKSDSVRAFRDEGVTMVELPYVGNASMVILMPDGDLEQFVASTSPQKLNQLKNLLMSERPSKADLFIPKFKLETKYDLKTIMQEMGTKDIFDEDSADLSGITGGRDLFVTKAIHKAVVEVNEEGTKAAAATVIEAGIRGMPPPDPLYRIDKPFLFVIRDNISGLNLFSGKVSRL